LRRSTKNPAVIVPIGFRSPKGNERHNLLKRTKPLASSIELIGISHAEKEDSETVNAHLESLDQRSVQGDTAEEFDNGLPWHF
tara:strand:- start:32361 stop:32609 length:249 start_codon:yes stop_codon:yes gene_type:complete